MNGPSLRIASSVRQVSVESDMTSRTLGTVLILSELERLERMAGFEGAGKNGESVFLTMHDTKSDPALIFCPYEYGKFRSRNSSHAPSSPGNRDPAVIPI